jgi:hypothetical protein
MAASIVRWINSTNGGVVSSKDVDISAVDVDEWMIVVHNIGSTTATIATPDDWEILFVKTTLGSRACAGFVKKKTSELEVSVSFVASASTGWSHALIGVLGAEKPDWIVGPVWTRSLHGTTLTNIIDGVTTLENDSVALVFSFEATTALESPNSIAGVNNGFTEIGYVQQSAVIETIWAGTKAIPTPVDVGDTTVTYRNTQASNGAGIMIAFPPGDYTPMGTQIKIGTGAFARLSFLDGAEVRQPPASVRVITPGFTTGEQFIAKPGGTMAHRGGSESFPDMSEYGYDQSILRGFGALEFSAQRTLDGWWFGCHNADINEVSGNTGLPNISAMTRAEVEAYANVDNPTVGHPSRPFYGLEEFLDKYGKTHVLMVDPKSAISFNTEFMTICEGIVDPARLMWKYFLGSPGSNTASNGAQAAINRGWSGTWGYCYSEDIDNGAFAEHAVKAGWTTLGLNIGAAQSYWDTVLAVGKPVIAHIASSQEMYNEAMSKGADLVQCSDVTSIVPVSIF